MGKRDKRIAYVNPLAQRSYAATSGTTIKDYFNRPRPTWEEFQQQIDKGKSTGSSTLAAYEEELNKKFKEELKKNREAVQSSGTKDKDFKHKKKRLHSSSLSSSNDDDDDDSKKRWQHRKKRKVKKHKQRKDTKDSPSDDTQRKVKTKKRKHSRHRDNSSSSEESRRKSKKQRKES